jgi:hypothetical protein
MAAPNDFAVGLCPRDVGAGRRKSQETREERIIHVCSGDDRDVYQAISVEPRGVVARRSLAPQPEESRVPLTAFLPFLDLLFRQAAPAHDGGHARQPGGSGW